MVRASRPEKLDRLIESVARGERDLASIKDAKLRDAVRVALRMHNDAQKSLDELARIRMRDRVMGSVRPRRPNLADRTVIAFELLAKPAPYAVRAITVFALSITLVAGGIVIGADTLPDDALYPLKIAGEDIRLTLALNAEDRASVQLSIAAHRFAEAQRLAASGRDEDALVASSTYSQQIAEAAAELAELEELQPEVVALAAQLDDRFNDQRSRMQALAQQLSTDPATARVSEIMAVVAAPTLAPGLVGVQRIAETAAGMAEHLATRAAKDADPRASPRPRATRAAEVTKRNAEYARAAAERAKAKGGKNRTAEGRADDPREDDEYFDYRDREYDEAD